MWQVQRRFLWSQRKSRSRLYFMWLCVGWDEEQEQLMSRNHGTVWLQRPSDRYETFMFMKGKATQFLESKALGIRSLICLLFTFCPLSLPVSKAWTLKGRGGNRPWWKSFEDPQGSSKIFKDLQRSCKDPHTQGSFKDPTGFYEDLVKIL